MRERVLVAMSGGVDSSVSAALLADEGYDVVGIFMRTGAHAPTATRSCCSAVDARDARRVAGILGIPFYAIDYAKAFRRIIERFVSDYNRGLTPNPCVLCNQWLKFGELLEFADGIGARTVATGHYARLTLRAGRPVLGRAHDRAKDQSYFLFALRPEQLARCRFPLAGLTKEEVRRIAAAKGLPVSSKPESMEICFVPGGDYRRLIADETPDALRPGEMVLRDGTVVGTHPGHQHFTIGQRRGLGVALGRPLYVVAIDAVRNRVVLGDEQDLQAQGLVAGGVNWIALDPPAPGAEVPCLAQVRHRHEAVPASAAVTDAGDLRLRFDAPERAVTPGQAIVLYDGEDVLAGGWIREVEPVPADLAVLVTAQP